MYNTIGKRGRQSDLRRFFTIKALQQIAVYLYTLDFSGCDPTVIPASTELA